MKAYWLARLAIIAALILLVTGVIGGFLAHTLYDGWHCSRYVDGRRIERRISGVDYRLLEF